MTGLAPVGIVTGLKFEAAILYRGGHGHGAQAPFVACAAGRAEVAERAARDMLERGARALISFGIAGALDPALAAGALILPDEVAAPGGESLTVDHNWRDRFRAMLAPAIAVSTTRLVSVVEPVASAAAKRSLAERSGAAAVDMESWPVARLAADRDVPFLAVRAVADEAGQDLPDAALCAMQPDGSLSLRRVLAALMRHPGQSGSLLRLGRNNKLAKRTLNRVAQTGLPVFGLD